MNVRQQALYSDLCRMQITPPGVTLSFEARLARENGWDLAGAIAVSNEYRKFLFLMLEAGHPVTPSDQVDQAWHLHLVYTDSYWNDLCGRIAKRPLHHGPTAGGSEESEKFTDWYERTKTSYRNFFGDPPPDEVWPDQKTRFGDDIHFQRVNVARNLVIPRPGHVIGRWINFCRKMLTRKRPGIAAAPASASTLLMAPLLPGILNPLDFNGRDFLIFYSITIAIGLIAAIILRMILRNRDTLDSVALEKTANQLNVEEVAFLTHGPKGPVDAAIAQLSHDGKLAADVANNRLEGNDEFSMKAPLLQQTILSAAGSRGGKTVFDIRKACGSAVVKLAESLKDRGLVESSSSYMLPRFSSVLIMLAVLLLGLGKIWVGIDRDKPVGFLILLSILVIVLIWAMFHRPRLTAKGNQVLEFLRQNVKKTGSIRAEPGDATAHDIGMSVALFGVAAMGTQLLDTNVANMLIHDKTRAWGDGASYTGGCGGDVGGGCGGGGCGGGGCGGCGG